MKSVFTKFLTYFLIGLLLCVWMPLHAKAEFTICIEDGSGKRCEPVPDEQGKTIFGIIGVVLGVSIIGGLFGLGDKDVVRDENDAYMLFEGNNCSQELVGSLGTTDQPPGKPVSWNVKKVKFIENDEARSVLIQRASAGEILRVYDDPGGGVGDDWTEITILRDIRTPYCIGSFEGPDSGRGIWEDRFVRLVHTHRNGLDGKISHVETDRDEGIRMRHLMTRIFPLF